MDWSGFSEVGVIDASADLPAHSYDELPAEPSPSDLEGEAGDPDFQGRPDDGPARARTIPINPELDPQQRSQIERLLQQYARVFRSEWGLLNDGTAMKITPRPDAQPVSTAPFRNSPRARQAIEKLLKEMAARGRVEPSDSPWSSPVFVVYNKSNKPRVVIDFRKVNQFVVRDAYPIPRQDEVLDAVRGAAFVSVFDLTKGFYQVPIEPASRKYTAFTSHLGLMQLRVAVMGYTNSPSFFQRRMNALLAPYLWQFAVAYLDDLIIWSRSFEEHLQHVGMVLQAVDRVNLTLAPEKASLAFFEVAALGHRVGRLGLATHEDKVRAMVELETPKDLKDLETALGLFNYYRQFVPHYARIARPLFELKTDITGGKTIVYKNQVKTEEKNGKPLAQYRDLQKQSLPWGEEHQHAFDSLKRRLASAEVLAPPNMEVPFILYTDASYAGFGAALHQKTDKERPILYISRLVTATERHYAPTELECACLVWAVEKLSHYLDGEGMTVYTDHAALQWILGINAAEKHRNGRLARWSLFLSQFNSRMKVIHRAGAAHANADALSRLVPSRGEVATSTDVTTRATLVDISDDWIADYQQDASFKQIVARATDSKEKRYQNFLWDHAMGRLLVRPVGDDTTRVCVPTSRLKAIVRFAHEQNAHAGIFKTFHHLRSTFFSPRMKAMVEQVLAECTSCRENKTMNHPEYGLTRAVQPSSSIPFDTIAIDWVTALPESGGDEYGPYNAFFTVTDKFSRMVRVVPCRKDDDAPLFADRFFNHIVRFQGLPRRIISDRDSKLTSEFWTAAIASLGVRSSMTTAYNPRADGQSERTNQVVEIALRHYVDQNQRDWDRFLPEVEFAVNNSVHASTRMAPFETVYGMRLRDGLTELSGLPSVPATRSFVVQRQLMRQRAAENIAFAAAQMAIILDRDRTDFEFKEGDEVMLRVKELRIRSGTIPNLHKKLGPQRIGPFKVKKKISRLSYELDLPASYRIHPVFTIAKLEKAIPGQRHSRPPIEIFPDYVAEAVRAQRISRGSLQYYVKWLDCGEHDNTWEDAADIKLRFPTIVSEWLEEEKDRSERQAHWERRRQETRQRRA